MNQSHNQSDQKITITIKGQVLTATLNRSDAARDFVSLLPLTLTLEDYAETEKISDLPEELSTSESPPGSAASAGDIAYYAPWGNLAIFYEDFRYAAGLIILGTIEDTLDVLKGSDSLEVTIQLVQ